MLIYFALESQTQKPLRNIILHKIIFVNVCISNCHDGLWMSQIWFFTSMVLLYASCGIILKNDVPSLKLMGDYKVI